MIQPATPNDKKALMAIAEAIGLFSAQELEELGRILAEYFDGNLGRNHFWITYNDSKPVGVAYYAPEPYTDGTWNLYFIAVHPDRQGEGIGTKLLHYVQQMLVFRGERILLVETSGLPKFERTQAFYLKHGFNQEARIREFYKAGDDKIIFRKPLNLFKGETKKNNSLF